MGIAVPFEVMENLGMGEVVDADPPPEPIPDPIVIPTMLQKAFLDHIQAFISEKGKMIKAPAKEANEMVEQETAIAGHSVSASSKGKEKIYEKASFNGNGFLTSAAVEILESGALNHISDIFMQPSVNLDMQVCQDVSAKEVLDQAVQGWSSRNIGDSSSGPSRKTGTHSGLMDVAEVMAEWDSFVSPISDELEEE